MDHAAFGEENIGAGAFGHAALPIQHHGIGIALALGAVLGNRADHIETRRFGMNRSGGRIGAAIIGHIQTDALHLLFHVEHRRPIPHRNRHIDGGMLGGNRHHLAAAPGDRADIAALETVFGDNQIFGSIQFGNRIRNGEIHDFSRMVEALRMFGGLENLAAIGALALEHAGAVMQTVAEHVQLGILPWHQLAIEPNPAVTQIKWDDGHCGRSSGSSPHPTANIPFWKRLIILCRF